MASDESVRPSKSALKREAEERQALGEALIGLPDTVLDALQLPESLRDAVEDARRFTSHGARLRQRQYIGKLMRAIDVEPIRVALAALQQEQRIEARRFQRIEQWRERLIKEPEAAIAALLAELPMADAERLRALATEAQKDASDGRTPRASRALFQYLRELFSLQ
jgi:ribosome-associated protein